MSIVTKSGDDGTSALWNGERISKSHPCLAFLGDMDELNCFIGLAMSAGSCLNEELEELQNILFEVGALAAKYESQDASQSEMTAMLEAFTLKIEKRIYSEEAALPELKNFILPGGSVKAAHLHVARAVSRRAERSVWAIENAPRVLTVFLNRLSDYLFMMARSCNSIEGHEERIWISQNSAFNHPAI